MYIQRKTDAERFEEHPDVAARFDEPEDDSLGAFAPDEVHARALQYRLTEVFSETSEDEKLPMRQRLAVIVGVTSALWLLIGAVVYAAL